MFYLQAKVDSLKKCMNGPDAEHYKTAKAMIEYEVPVVPRKAFTSAECDTIYSIYQSLCSQSAQPMRTIFEGQPVVDRSQSDPI